MEYIQLEQNEVFKATKPGLYRVNGDDSDFNIHLAYGEPVYQISFTEADYNSILEVFKGELMAEELLKKESFMKSLSNTPNTMPIVLDDENKVSEKFALDMLRIALKKD